MLGRVRGARDLVTSKDTALSTIRLQPSSFQRPGGYSSSKSNLRERRLTVTFRTANAPVAVYHGLGFVPSGFEVLSKTSGTIYSDFPLRASSRVIMLKSNTAGVLADILVR